MNSRRRKNFVKLMFVAVTVFALCPPTSTSHLIPEFMSITALLGGLVKLPCDIRPLNTTDTTEMVLWYKDDMQTPIYRIDARETDSRHGQFVRPDFKGRVYFSKSTEPAYLRIAGMRNEDAGVYRCRVDYQVERTRNTKIYLSIIVPPTKPVIYNENGKKLIDVIGPFKEGESLTVICKTKYGSPTPKLIWLWNNITVDSDYEEEKSTVVRNTYNIKKLFREHHDTKLTCLAENSNISVKTTSILLKLQLKPQVVEITSENVDLAAGNIARYVCVSSGSEPPAIITWWKGKEQLINQQDSMSSDNKTTVSVVTFISREQDDGKQLVCRATNPKIVKSDLENGRKIVVHYKPIVRLKSSSLMVKEGSDVIFECDIRANPRAHTLQWLLNGRAIDENITKVVIRDNSFELKDVTRDQSGTYRCSARNKEGMGISNAKDIQVKYAPVCYWKGGMRKVVVPHDIMTAKCRVNSHSSNVTFQWAFNTQQSQKNIINYTKDGTTSTLSWKPDEIYGYGSLFCWGINDVGHQLEPCKFEIYKAEKPENVGNCSVLEETSSSLKVYCTKGDDGGIKQHFVMEIYYESQTEPVKNISAFDIPLFKATDLTANKTYMIEIYAVNRRGRSQPVGLIARTLPSSDNEDDALLRDQVHVGPLIAVLFGIIGALIITAVAVVSCFRIRARNESKQRERAAAAAADCRPYSKYTEVEAQNPDVVPSDSLEAVVSSCLQSMIVVEPYRGIHTFKNGHRLEKVMDREGKPIINVCQNELPLSTSCLDVRFIRKRSESSDGTNSAGFRRKSGVFHLPSESDPECEDDTTTPLFTRKRESSV